MIAKIIKLFHNNARTTANSLNLFQLQCFMKKTLHLQPSCDKDRDIRGIIVHRESTQQGLVKYQFNMVFPDAQLYLYFSVNTTQQ